MTRSFSLFYYDVVPNVVEMKIVKKLPPTVIEEYKDLITHTEFEIEIIEVFKGNINKEYKTLRVVQMGWTSCNWMPEVGTQYLFYLGDNFADTNQFFDNPLKNKGVFESTFGCQRSLESEGTDYHSEIKALRTIRDKTRGKFKIDQSSLFDSGKRNYFSIRGQMKNGKRHGKWILAEPRIYRSKEIDLKSKVIEILYKHGEVISVTQHPYNEGYERGSFIRRWKQYYESLIQPVDKT